MERKEIASGRGYESFDRQFGKGKIPSGSTIYIFQHRHGFAYVVNEEGILEWTSDRNVRKSTQDMLGERFLWDAVKE